MAPTLSEYAVGRYADACQSGQGQALAAVAMRAVGIVRGAPFSPGKRPPLPCSPRAAYRKVKPPWLEQNAAQTRAEVAASVAVCRNRGYSPSAAQYR